MDIVSTNYRAAKAHSLALPAIHHSKVHTLLQDNPQVDLRCYLPLVKTPSSVLHAEDIGAREPTLLEDGK